MNQVGSLSIAHGSLTSNLSHAYSASIMVSCAKMYQPVEEKMTEFPIVEKNLANGDSKMPFSRQAYGFVTPAVECNDLQKLFSSFLLSSSSSCTI